ncbi:50S ribosomal protein L29 [candidate division TA06 bacterium]|uniref:Large ribosomal subunit protein uL29 n=1 Tax=candidate division TA06 bacterium TaxID=2250710 RepID=A0A523UWZ0_UNCT6|nr:MAG: 50S ribosomal protein L29 [candidate division TA06 bacterium]TET79473.1 MAG: 50S ribosomal protein L29 [candidate division TA06 bacterium]
MRDIEKLREMTPEELNTKLHELGEEFFSLRFRNKSPGIPNPLKLRQLRREIARVKTIMREGESGIRSSRTGEGEDEGGKR